MNNRREIPIRDVIASTDPALRGLVTVAKRIWTCNRALNSELDEPLRSHLQVANIKGDRLVIQCDSPAWSARARLIVPRILRLVNRQRNHSPIRDVEIITRPRAFGDNPARPPKPHLSEQTRRLLRDVATGIENPALSRVLLRLSQRDR